MFADDPLPALLLLVPVLILFGWQLWRSLARFATRPGGRRLSPRAILAVLALIAVFLLALL